MKKKLYRSSTDKMICGVLAGFAEYIDVDPTIVRLVYAALTLFTAGFPGILFYIICAIVIPQKPFDVERLLQKPVFKPNKKIFSLPFSDGYFTAPRI